MPEQHAGVDAAPGANRRRAPADPAPRADRERGRQPGPEIGQGPSESQHRSADRDQDRYRGPQLDLAGVLRTLRRRADLSQRELAERSGLPRGTVGSIESGAARNPQLRTVERLVTAAGARLVVVDADGREPAPDRDPRRDTGRRRFPAHLDALPYPRRLGRFRPVRGPSGFSFLRNRRRRDLARIAAAGEHVRGSLAYDVRLLRPGDQETLAALQADAAELDLAGRAAVPCPLSASDALAYLRDPYLWHWVAQERGIIDPTLRGRVLAHLAARVHQRPTGERSMVVVDLGIRAEHRDGVPGIMLVATLSDLAARLGVDRIVAAVDRPAVITALRGLGFRHRRGVITLEG